LTSFVSKDTMMGNPLAAAGREQMSVLLTMALKEIRLLGWDGKAEQAADLADAVALLPSAMFAPDFDLEGVERNLRDYQDRYPGREGEGLTFDYAAFLRRLDTGGMTTARQPEPAGTTVV
jgi:hypothetical protein